MSISAAAASSAVTNTVTSRSFIPFTSGLIIFVYAFFWPAQYGAWLGTIVHSFRVASGI
jgi:hypothetical protein